MTIEEHVGRRVGARRRQLGVDAATLANTLQISLYILEGWEAGLQRIPSAAILTMASALNCKISYFFDGLRHGDNASDLTRIRLIGGTDLDE